MLVNTSKNTKICQTSLISFFYFIKQLKCSNSLKKLKQTFRISIQVTEYPAFSILADKFPQTFPVKKDKKAYSSMGIAIIIRLDW